MKVRLAIAASAFSLVLLACAPALAQDDVSRRVGPAVVTILTQGSSGRFEAVGSGVFVRADGVLLTAYSLVRGAREIQVRVADGEIYDHAEVVSTDERRNIAVLRVYATSTPFVAVGVADESWVGTQVRAVYSAGGQVMAEPGGVLSSISLADELPGAGTGFRVLKFTGPLAAEASGGVLVDGYARVIGLIAPVPQAQTRSYAVPLYNLVGMARAVPAAQAPGPAVALSQGPRDLNRAIPVYQPSTTPIAPMPPVTVPQRPTTALTPAGPGSVVVQETDPVKLFASSKTLHVESYSNVFKPVQLLNELRKREEFAAWGVSFVDEREVADLFLYIEHVPLTWEFTFTVKHQRTGLVIATGKVYAWGGGDGGRLMASRVVEKLKALRAAAKPDNKSDGGATKKEK